MKTSVKCATPFGSMDTVKLFTNRVHWKELCCEHAPLSLCEFTPKLLYRGSWTDLLAHYTNHIKLTTSFWKPFFFFPRILFLCSTPAASVCLLFAASHLYLMAFLQPNVKFELIMCKLVGLTNNWIQKLFIVKESIWQLSFNVRVQVPPVHKCNAK